jgi:hypothetical protein
METNKETNKIAKSKGQSPSSEPNIFSAVMKENALYETSFHYLIHTNPLLLPTLSQNNLVHTSL